jgi:hypothetical protein
MKIKVYTIDIQFNRWLKRAVRYGVIPIVFLLGLAHLLRADVQIPHSFSNGQVVSAAQMNDNFVALQTGINSLGSTVTTLQGTVTALQGTQANAAVPRGAIVMWSGTIAQIPTGWQLCNGANGTPNLSDRFILSVANSSEDPGVTGGANSIALSVSQLPSHTHTGTTGGESADHTHGGTTAAAGGHSHTYGYHANVLSVDDVYPGSGGSGAWRNETTTTTSAVGDHGHAFTTAGASADHTHTFSTSATGLGSPIDSRPAFYKLAFIIKS